MLVHFSALILSISTLLCVYNFIQQCPEGPCVGLTIQRCIFSVLVSLAVAAWGLKKKSLDWSGAIMGVFVGLVHTLASYSFLSCLFTFFYTSSKATHFRELTREKKKYAAKEGGGRTWHQVLCNGGASAQFSLLFLAFANGPSEESLDFHLHPLRSWLQAAVLCALAAANGDTWASEISTVVCKEPPKLITSMKTVPVGTNGGITQTGVLLSIAGGAVIGLSYVLVLGMFQTTTLVQILMLVCLGAAAGLFGSALDSVLGATLQFSGISRTGCIVDIPGPGVVPICGRPLLSNHSVNLLMTTATAIVLPTLLLITLRS